MLPPYQQRMLAGGTEDKEHAMSQNLDISPAVVGIDIGKISFHIVGQNQRGAIVLRMGRTDSWGPQNLHSKQTKLFRATRQDFRRTSDCTVSSLASLAAPMWLMDSQCWSADRLVVRTPPDSL